MHETSFNNTLRDYLTGQDIEETTYEEFRQALAKLLVEEKGYPKDNLRPKVELKYKIEGKDYLRELDLVAYDDEGRALMVILFCSGEVGSYERETVLAGRLVENGPSFLSLVTDTTDATLMHTDSGEVIERGMRALPRWDKLLKMTGGMKRMTITTEDRSKNLRIFHAYSGFLYGACCGSSCSSD